MHTIEDTGTEGIITTVDVIEENALTLDPDHETTNEDLEKENLVQNTPERVVVEVKADLLEKSIGK